MDDLAVGRVFRAIRVRKAWRQEDLARVAGVSRQTVSRVELGRLDGVPLGSLRRVFAAVDVGVALAPRGVGADLPRIADAHHAAMHEDMARLFAALDGWVAVPEVTFSVYGERGSIDILAWHPTAKALLVVEIKSVVPDIQATIAGIDRKARIAPAMAGQREWAIDKVARVLVVPDDRTSRRRVERFAYTFDRALPARTVAIRRWIAAPAGSIAGVLFLSDFRRARARHRVRGSTTAATLNRPSTN